jgi:hypothetical protein
VRHIPRTLITYQFSHAVVNVQFHANQFHWTLVYAGKPKETYEAMRVCTVNNCNLSSRTPIHVQRQLMSHSGTSSGIYITWQDPHLCRPGGQGVRVVQH